MNQPVAELGMVRSRTMGDFHLTEFVQPPHRRLAWHEHHASSICFVVSGSYAERARGVQRECLPQSVVFKPAAERHADEFGHRGGTCLLIEITSDRLEAIEPYSDITTRPGSFRTARLAGLGQHIFSEFIEGDALSPLAVEALVLELVVEASRARVVECTHRRPAWLIRARDLIHDRLDQPLTLSSIAREVGIHPAHLSRTFRAHYQRSLGDYARRLRIERAARELADGNATIAEIGVRSGFCDQSHFSRVFRRYTGLTPAAFRATTTGHSRTSTQLPS